MNGRNNAARILVALGAMVLIAAALLHLSDYPKDLPAVSASNLGVPLQRAVRALYFLVGWDWIAIAIITLISALTATHLGKLVVVFCGFALLVNMAVTLAFMGWFKGTDMLLVSALMTLCGGLLFSKYRRLPALAKAHTVQDRP
jgi:hypothetical protein